MGVMRNLVRSLAKRAAKYAGIPLRDPALVQMLGSQPTASGVDVDENLAMNLSAVWAAATVISSNLAAMPCVPYDGNKEAKDHPSYKMLLCAPNSEMTPVMMAQTQAYHALLWGNSYADTDKVSEDSMATEMWPLMPNQVTPMRYSTGEIYYDFKALYEGEKDEEIPWWRVVHVPGLSFDGLKGYNVIDQARESLGIAVAAEKFGAAFFGRGCTPGGILEYPEELKMTRRARANLRESFELLHRGPDNSHRLMILEQGMTYKPLMVAPDTAQFLETRKFQVVEVARWFNIPPHMLRELDRATLNNIEHQSIEFLQQTLRPWMLKFAQEYRRKIFGRHDQDRYYVRHQTKNLLMTDTKTRYEAYSTGRNGGWVTLNDIMRDEGYELLPPEIGDTRLAPSTMRTLGQDPFAPIDPLVMAAAIRTVMAMPKASPECTATILRGFMPQASEALVCELVKAVGAEGTWAVSDPTEKSGMASAVAELQKMVYGEKVPADAAANAAMVLLGVSADEAKRMFP